VFIEFSLPENNSYNYVLTLIKLNIVDWATQQQIPYTEKTIKYTHRLAFNQDEHYTIFSMTWNPTPNLEFKIIDRKW
jgi:hypothetical protein